MIKWIKNFIYSHTYYHNIKIYDFNMAWRFYVYNSSYIKNMSFCMLNDININQSIVKDGLLIYPKWDFSDVDGVKFTAIDSPSLKIEWMDGTVDFYFCYKYAKVNKLKTKIKEEKYLSGNHHRWDCKIINNRLVLEKNELQRSYKMQ